MEHYTASPQIPNNPSNPSHKLPRLTPRRRQPTPQNPLPVPETPELAQPSASNSITFSHPRRRILSPTDHTLFLESPTYKLVLSFIFTLAESVTDTPTSAIKDSDLSPTVQQILTVLEDSECLLAEYIPKDQGGSRFGNPRFRDYLDGLGTKHEAWHKSLGVSDPAAIEELSTYFMQSFGNRTRMDYGSGHELNFILWLLCLYQLSILKRADFPALVLRIFTRYLKFMRLIQLTYYLEPAGSHGVWGLDDYQFLPFLFGSSQLLHHPYLRPRVVNQQLELDEYGRDYMYLDQVAFVNSVKNVEGLRWHSPMLDDISASKSWEKVYQGMKRMFVKEVLGKLPVMQHFLFGSLIAAEEGMGEEQESEGQDGESPEGEEVIVMKDGMKHVHTASSWGDCCGIKVPSSIGAAQEMKKRMGGDAGLRRVPFD